MREKTNKFAIVEKVEGHKQTSHAFTVDVEEWFQVGAFENVFDTDSWPTLESRAYIQTVALLDLLENLDIKATFFCLGWVAKAHPELLRKLTNQGHEVACHGMAHSRLFTMDREHVRQDIDGAKKLIEDATGTPVRGYRAPSFSLTKDVWWVYEVLMELGFDYSSSLYPVKTDHYGMAQAPRKPFYPIEDEAIIEIPMTVCDLPFKRFPASGGGYFRLFPYFLSRYLMKHGSLQAESPGIFYMHPWEMDLGQPYIKQAPLLSRFRHYQGQKNLPKKLANLSRDFNWGRMCDVYGDLVPLHKVEGQA